MKQINYYYFDNNYHMENYVVDIHLNLDSFDKLIYYFVGFLHFYLYLYLMFILYILEGYIHILAEVGHFSK
jgi:hypothetical protein